ncbi:MAG: signal peptidase I [Candidatus Omnitrophota bacterium]
MRDKKPQSTGALKKKSLAREWVEAIVIAAILAMIIKVFAVEAFKIPSGSMRPTLIEGDLILVNKFIYGAKLPFTYLHLPAFREPRRGEVIVFVYPHNPKKDFIKRLIAKEGETVEIKNGTVYVNDKPLLDAPFYQRYYYNRGEFAQQGQKVTVPKDSFFVLGDNSASSQDSRYWGFVPKRNLLGRAMIIYWPFWRIRAIK